MSMVRTTVSEDEVADFQRECRTAGYDPSEFSVAAMEDSPPERAHITRIVSVQRTVSGKPVTIQFDGSSGQDWIVPAVAVLARGDFGPK